MKGLHRPLGIGIVAGCVIVALALAAVIIASMVRTTSAANPRAVQDQKNLTQDGAIRRLTEENRLQDAHNVNTARALMRAAVTEVWTGRADQARLLAITAMNGLIGLHHQPCGGSQVVAVPGVHVPPALRRFFGEGDPYTILDGSGRGADEVLQVRVHAETTC